MLIYPNIVNMLGEMTIDINAMCLDRTQTYIHMIEQRMSATCMVLNPSIARCVSRASGYKRIAFIKLPLDATFRKSMTGAQRRSTSSHRTE